MKQIKILMLGALCAVALATMGGCSDDTSHPEPVIDDWKVYLSRSTNGHVTVALRYDNTISYGTLIPAADENAPGTWLDDKKPTWPASGNVEVITFSPAVEELPYQIDATQNVAYTMDYATCTPDAKPEKFVLKHLMAQLEVHIKLHDEAEHHYQPQDATVSLYTTATVDYPNMCLTTPATMNEAFVLGTFSKEGNDHTATDENWVNTAQIVIPQTLQAGIPCLSFKAGDRTYTYTPENNIELKAGKKTKLYLVAYQNDYVTLGNVTVTPWTDGGTIDAGEAEEDTSVSS